MQINIQNVRDKKIRSSLKFAYDHGYLGATESVSDTLLAIVEYLFKNHPHKEDRPTYKVVRLWAKDNGVTNHVSQSAIKTAFNVCYPDDTDRKHQKKSVDIIDYAIGTRFVEPLLSLGEEGLRDSGEIDRLINNAWLRIIIPLVRYDLEKERSKEPKHFDFKHAPITSSELCCTLLEDEDAEFSPYLCQRVIQHKLGLIISWDAATRSTKTIGEIRQAKNLELDFEVFELAYQWVRSHALPLVESCISDKLPIQNVKESLNTIFRLLLVETIKNKLHIV